MKKLLIAAFMVAGFFSANAQGADFGVTAGFLDAKAKISSGGNSISTSESGFYIGAIADFTVSEKFHIQPELVYANANDADAILLPVMGKFYVSEGLNIQAGPQFDFSLEDVPNDFTGFGIALGTGLGYDINEDFFVEGRYTFQLNDYYTGDGDFELKGNYLTIGVGYKF